MGRLGEGFTCGVIGLAFGWGRGDEVDVRAGGEAVRRGGDVLRRDS